MAGFIEAIDIRKDFGAVSECRAKKIISCLRNGDVRAMPNIDYRIEKDTMGEIRVPLRKYWAAQTQRSLENFLIGTEKMPLEIIRAFGILKKAAAIANVNLKKLSPENGRLIALACDEIIPTNSLACNWDLVLHL